MLKVCKERLQQLVIVVFFLSIVTFSLMKLAPGDPVLHLLGIDVVHVTQEQEAALREEMGFNQPVLVQYGKWMLNVLRLDFGNSYFSKQPVMEELLETLPTTAQLTAGGLIVMVLIAAPLGILAAKYPGRWPDHVSRLLALVGSSIPSFWMGLLLIYFFAYKLQWVPTMGKGTWQQMILPSLTLGIAIAAVYARLLRAGLLEALSQEYIRAARARGLSEWRIFLRHAMRAALLPVITVFGLSLSNLLAGIVVIEILFSWPGMGSLAVDAIFKRDYPVIQGYVMLTGIFVVMVNLVVDLTYGWLDPRIRLGRAKGER